MDRVGIFEAKSRFSELVERAEAGDEVTITRHGKPVAKIVPVRAKDVSAQRAVIFDEITAFSKTIKSKRFNLRKVIEQGRK